MKKLSKFNLLILFIFLSFMSLTSFSNSDEMFNKGKQIFLNNGTCATCHMLSDAQSSGMIGPNLDEIRPDKNRVVIAVTRGIGVMPAFEGTLSDDEIEAVSYYVSKTVK
tara:strand:- start:200 stop:526 length:327 start_codon:yes stop_codon:yes gene_type:complete